MWFQKISILPPQKGLEIPGSRGVSKTQKFKAMYEAKLEYPEGWGGHTANPFHGGVWIFSGTTHFNKSVMSQCTTWILSLVDFVERYSSINNDDLRNNLLIGYKPVVPLTSCVT